MDEDITPRPSTATATIPSSPPFDPRLYALSPTSSEPPLFSSDDAVDAADVTNYVSPRLKRKRAGPWWEAEGGEPPAEVKKAKLSRNFDSGVWMMSDGTDDSSESAVSTQLAPSTFETLDERIQRETKDMGSREAALYRIVQEGVESNNAVYHLHCMNLSDRELRHIGELNQVIRAPPDPGIDAPTEGQYRSMVPNLYIRLSHNALSLLHPSLFKLQHLTTLVLRSNHIQEIPSQIGQLRSLKELDLSLNKLAWLPCEILQLLTPHGNLERLQLIGNPLIGKEPDHGFFNDHWRYHPVESPEKRLEVVKLHHMAQIAPSPASLVPFVIAIKAIESSWPEYTPPSHHQFNTTLINQSPRTEGLNGATFIGRTAISYYDHLGQLLKESAKPPKSKKDDFDFIVKTTRSTFSAPETWFEPSPRSKVPSLFTLSVNKSVALAPPSELSEMIGEETPRQIELALERAKENIVSSFGPLHTCYCCGREYVVVAAEWIEFWCTNPNTTLLPIKVRVCSWGCVPDELAEKP